MQAMRRVAMGEAPARYEAAVATVVLRSLGLDADEAAEVARRPLPDLAPPAAAERSAPRPVTRAAGQPGRKRPAH